MKILYDNSKKSEKIYKHYLYYYTQKKYVKNKLNNNLSNTKIHFFFRHSYTQLDFMV